MKIFLVINWEVLLNISNYKKLLDHWCLDKNLFNWIFFYLKKSEKFFVKISFDSKENFLGLKIIPNDNQKKILNKIYEIRMTKYKEIILITKILRISF